MSASEVLYVFMAPAVFTHVHTPTHIHIHTHSSANYLVSALRTLEREGMNVEPERKRLKWRMARDGDRR